MSPDHCAWAIWAVDQVYAQDAMEYFVEKPIAAVATAVALILSFVLLLWRPKRATEPVSPIHAQLTARWGLRC